MSWSSTESHSINMVASCQWFFRNSSYCLSSAGPTADSLKQWLVVFEGESGSLYEGGTFFALLTFDDDYPFTPPTVIPSHLFIHFLRILSFQLEFKTRIYHCNIHQSSGLVKHDIFDKNWSPTITIRQIIQKVANLLVQCEPGLSLFLLDYHLHLFSL